MTLDLGTTSLSQARLARGLTLEDAERSTRISRKFLIALEEHDYSVFPAPIYARGFLRTYCRYLGVDPEAQLAELPAGWTESTTAATQLAPVSTRGPMTFNVAWIVAGVLLVAIVGLGFYVSQGGGGDLGALQEQGQQHTQVPDGSAAVAGTGASNEQSQASAEPTSETAVGRSLEAALPGTLPDFVNVDADEATSYLDDEDIAYLRIDTASTSVAAGLVISQSPRAGTDTDDVNQVTLTVSTGSTSQGVTRTDCDVLEASNQRSASEQAYYENNCETTAAPTPTKLPDRTTCEEIRGTDYRSTAERTFFLNNCIIQ